MVEARTRLLFRASLSRWWAVLLALGLLGLIMACAKEPREGSQIAAGQQSGAQSSRSTSLKPLQLTPAEGSGREPFTVTGDGMPPGRAVQFEWDTYDGAYTAEIGVGAVKYLGRKFTRKRIALGTAVAGGDGHVTANLTAPEDYGDVHSVYAIVDGKEVARGEYRVFTSAIISSAEGPVGAPVTITVRGMGWKNGENALGLYYDGKYMGLVTAVTTRGSAVVRLRASGPVGPHVIQLGDVVSDAYQAKQGQPALVPSSARFTWSFHVTKDEGAPPQTLGWPSGSRVPTLADAIPRERLWGAPVAQGWGVGLLPPFGPTGSRSALWARSSLPPGAEVELLWATPKRSAAAGACLRSPWVKA